MTPGHTRDQFATCTLANRITFSPSRNPFWNDKFLRLAAEYDNYRKRTAKEKESIYQDARMDTIGKFLEVYDNLERAVRQAGDLSSSFGGN